MDLLLLMLLPVILIGFVVWIIVRGVQKSYRDDAAAKAFAEGRGWQFAEMDFAYGKLWEWGPFAETGDGTARNVMRGEMQFTDASGRAVSRPVHSLHYKVTDTIYTEENNSTTTDSHFHIVAVEVPFQLPELHLTPENILSRKFSRDIEFDDPEFDNKWQVRGPDESAIRRVLDIRVRKDLVDPRHKGKRYSLVDGYLFVWTKDQQRIENIDPMLEAANSLINLLPRA